MSLERRFAEAEREEILVGGRMLRQVWRCPVPAGVVRLHRVRVTDERHQGLVVDTDVDVSVAGRTGRRFVLWAHTAPVDVEIDVDEPTELRIWNVWDDGDMIHAWLGSASIHARTTGDSTRLSCRDGHGDDLEAEPDDLVVDLSIEPAG